MGVSRRSYAAQRGVSEAAVRKAIATGRIATLVDGTIDPDRADAEWGTQTDPAKQRGQQARQMGAEIAAGTARAAATKPVPQAALKAVADTLREAGTEPGPGEATGGEVSFLRTRTANEVLKAQTAKVRLEKMKAEVIDRARATSNLLASDGLHRHRGQTRQPPHRSRRSSARCKAREYLWPIADCPFLPFMTQSFCAQGAGPALT